MVIIVVSKILGDIFLKVFDLSPFHHDKIGHMPIIRMAGIIIGTTVVL